jgi:hypothetical protein
VVTDWYLRDVVDAGKQPLAILFVAFVVTFLFIRLSVRMIRAGVSWWPGNIEGGGVHVHHVVFGAVFVLIAGAGGFSPVGDAPPWAEIFAGLFGCGAALVLDEFALVLHLSDVYWSEEGRTSVDAVFLAAATIGLLLFGVAPFGVNDIADTTDASTGLALAYAWTVAVGSVLVMVTLLKGKIWTGVFGIFLPVLALVGAVRLARPRSPWARWRYAEGSHRAQRAARREVQSRAQWVRARTKVQDAVAGRPDDKP